MKLLPKHGNFLKKFTRVKSSLSTTSRELRQQFAACSGEDDNGKFRIERVKPTSLDSIGPYAKNFSFSCIHIV